jgi:hypothetical protein
VNKRKIIYILKRYSIWKAWCESQYCGLLDFLGQLPVAGTMAVIVNKEEEGQGAGVSEVTIPCVFIWFIFIGRVSRDLFLKKASELNL